MRVFFTINFSQRSYIRAEMKLLCFFFYFCFAAIFSYTVLVIGGFHSILQDTLLFLQYFSCEAYGVDPSSPCVLEVDRRQDQSLILLSNIMLIFAPYITLIYIVPVNKVKD